MNRLYDRVLENIEVKEPTQEFRKTYFPGDTPEHIVQIAYIGYIESRLIGVTMNDPACQLGHGIGRLIKLSQVFLTADPKLEEFIDLRYAMGILAGTSLAKYIWPGELANWAATSLTMVRAHLEAVVESRMGGERIRVPEYCQRLWRLRDAPYFWLGTSKKLKALAAELHDLPEDYFIN